MSLQTKISLSRGVTEPSPRRFPFFLGISVFWLALSLLTDGINTLLLPSRLQALIPLQRQAAVLGLLTFSGLLAGMLIQPLAGAFSDRLKPKTGRKGLLAAGAFIALLCLAAFGFSSSLISLAAAYLVLQVSASSAQAAQQGFIPDLVPKEKRGRASGWKAFMDIAGAALGFAILGQILGTGQPNLALLVIGVLTLAALLLTIFLVREGKTEGQEINSVTQPEIDLPFSSSLRRAFIRVVLARFLFLLGTYTVGRFLLLFVSSRLNLDPEAAARQAGTLLAGLALVTLLAAPLAGQASDRWGRSPVSLTGSLLAAAGAAGMAYAPSLLLMFASGSLLSLGSAAFASSNWALTADVVPPEKAARYFGLANFGTAGAAAAAGLFGPAVDWLNSISPGSGYPALFAVAAAIFLLSALVMRKGSAVVPAVST